MDNRLISGLWKRNAEKSADTVILYDRGDFHSCYGNDAKLLAKGTFQSEALIRTLNSDKGQLVYININKNQYVRVLRELLFKYQHRVEVYAVKGTSWELIQKGSPGNLVDFEDVLGEASDELSTTSSAVLAVKLESLSAEVKNVALACCDTSTFTLSVAEFADGPHLANLEAALVHLAPKECVIPAENNDDYNQAEKILRRANVSIAKRKKGLFSSEHADQDLKFLLGDKGAATHLSETSLEKAGGCMSALSKYLSLSSDSTNRARFKLERFQLDRFMRIDSSAVRALELYCTSYTQSRKGTLQASLNKCRSVPGQKLLDVWIRQPLTDLAKLEERLDIVESLVCDASVRADLYENILCRVPDLLRLAKRLVRKKSTLQECFRLYQLIKTLPQLIEALTTLTEQSAFKSSVTEMFLEPIAVSQQSFIKFVELIDSTLDMDYLNGSNEFRIKPDFDPNLLNLSEKMDALCEQMDEHSHTMARSLKLDLGKSLKLDKNPQTGYGFRVTRKDEKLIRGNRSLTVLDAKTAGVRFTDSTLQSLNEEYLQLKGAYDKTQEQVIEQIIEVAAGYVEALRRLSAVLALLDVLVSFAHVAATAPIPYVRPKLLAKGSGVLRLKECRHPCLEAQDGVSFIANDAHFGQNGHTLTLVTGPNMGGKSTYLRQTALAVLMAQMGSFVACQEAEISLLDAIFTRVGACDYQSKGISTFMAEMLESATILEAATADSLVVIDELGRGTSTYDGFGLAWAIAEEIASKIRCFCLFATHFHELTALAQEQPSVRNVHMEAMTDKNQLTLLFRVKPGVADESLGIHVAELVKFPPEIVQTAWQKLGQLEGGTAPRQDSDGGELQAQIAHIKRVALTHPSELRTAVNQLCSLEL